jgi:hypothetical protein
LLPVFLIPVLCPVLCLIRDPIQALALFAYFYSRAHSPLVNFSEDQFATHALAFTRGVHGAFLIALYHRFVTCCATSVAFVCFYHRPGKYAFNWLIRVFFKLRFNSANSKFFTTNLCQAHPQKLCADLWISSEHLHLTRMPVGVGQRAQKECRSFFFDPLFFLCLGFS